MRPVNSDKIGAGLGVPVPVAPRGGLVGCSARDGAIVVGEVNPGESNEMTPNPVRTGEFAIDKLAEALFLPIFDRRQTNDLSSGRWDEGQHRALRERCRRGVQDGGRVNPGMTSALLLSVDSEAIVQILAKAERPVCGAVPGIQRALPRRRFASPGGPGRELMITVILDPNERVRRMGFGDAAATLRVAGIAIRPPLTEAAVRHRKPVIPKAAQDVGTADGAQSRFNTTFELIEREGDLPSKGNRIALKTIWGDFASLLGKFLLLASRSRTRASLDIPETGGLFRFSRPVPNHPGRQDRRETAPGARYRGRRPGWRTAGLHRIPWEPCRLAGLPARRRARRMRELAGARLA